MTISNEEYMALSLRSKKLELERLKIAHEINLAVFETKKDNLNKEICSLEGQLRT